MSVDHDHLVAVIEPIVTAAGLDLEEVKVSAAGKRSRVQVLIDQDGGCNLDLCAEVSRAIANALEANDPFGPFGADPYVLEVGSPGVSRPLTLPRHWRRNKSRLVLVERVGHPDVQGRIVESDDNTVTLDVAGAPVVVNQSEVTRAVVQVEFSRPEDK